MRTHRALIGVWLCGVGSLTAQEPAWQVEKTSLTVNSEWESTLAVRASNAARKTVVDLEAKVRLTRVDGAYALGDKLAVVGAAGNASQIAIFDLARKQETDSFCGGVPRRISDKWIAYIECYLPHGMGEPREVVLIYDLTKTPIENRLPASRVGLELPAPITGVPAEVGIPIYPEWNVRNRSYRNMVEKPEDGETILAYASFLLLDQNRLVFLASRGRDFLSSENYLVVVDLSLGLGSPKIKSLDIPKYDLKKPGENPRFVKVFKMEAAAPDAVRLSVPSDEYGVSSILVTIPR